MSSCITLGTPRTCPYGSKPKEEVHQFVWGIANFFAQKQVKALVIACNTATVAAGLEEMQKAFPFSILDVIGPGSKAAIVKSKNMRIGVIGTEGTIQSRAHEEALKSLVPEIQVFNQATPEFAKIVEEGRVDTPETKQIAQKYLKTLKEKGVDTIILGCTHYPLLSQVIQDVMGEQVTLVDPAQETARELREVLNSRDLLTKKLEPKAHQFYTSGSSDSIKRIGRELLGLKLSVEQVVI